MYISSTTRAEVCIEYINGASLSQIGDKYGASMNWVRGILQKSNVALRSQGGRTKIPEWKYYGFYEAFMGGETSQYLADINELNIRTIDKMIHKVENDYERYKEMWTKSQIALAEHEEHLKEQQ